MELILIMMEVKSKGEHISRSIVAGAKSAINRLQNSGVQDENKKVHVTKEPIRKIMIEIGLPT